MTPDALAALLASPLSHALFGLVGGFAYLARQALKGYAINRAEYLARPLLGALVAVLLTVTFQLPDHITSVLVGYFGVDLWDAIAARFDPDLSKATTGGGTGLPFAFPKATAKAAVVAPSTDAAPVVVRMESSPGSAAPVAVVDTPPDVTPTPTPPDDEHQ